MAADGGRSGAADLSGLVGSRICHDLVGPVGAIGNGLELLSMAGERPPELELVTESADSANARLRFFRIAFGAAGTGREIAARELTGAATGALAPGGLELTTDLSGGLPRREARLAALLLLCMESGLPRGGRVTLSRDAEGWRVTGAGPKLRADAAFWNLLAQPADATDPASVHFALAGQAAAAEGRTARVDFADDTILLSA